jgi:hypothetical protein
VVLNLVVNTTSSTNIDTSICQGSTYNLPWGGVATSAGTYSHTYVSSNGCDSLVNVTVITTPPPVAGTVTFNGINPICSSQNFSNYVEVIGSFGTIQWQDEYNIFTNQYADVQGANAVRYYLQSANGNDYVIYYRVKVSNGNCPSVYSEPTEEIQYRSDVNNGIINSTNPSCSGNCNGSISFSNSGFVFNYDILKDGQPFSSGNFIYNLNLQNLCAGSYSIYIYNNCSSYNGSVILTNTITNLTVPQFNIDTISDV